MVTPVIETIRKKSEKASKLYIRTIFQAFAVDSIIALEISERFEN